MSDAVVINNGVSSAVFVGTPDAANAAAQVALATAQATAAANSATAAAGSQAAAALLAGGNAEIASRGAYTNLLGGFTPTVTNIDDATTPTLTFSALGTGLKLQTPNFNKRLLASTNLKTGAACARFTTTITVNTAPGASNFGIGFAAGSTYTAIYWGKTNGFFATDTNLSGSAVITNLSTTLPTYAVGDVLTFDAVVTSAGIAYVTVSKNGGPRYGFGSIAVPVGSTFQLFVWDQSGSTSAATYSVDQQAMSSVADGYAISRAVADYMARYGASIALAMGLAAPTIRTVPAAFIAPRLPSGFKVAAIPGTRYFTSTLDLQPLIYADDPRAFVQYIDPVAGNDNNPGTVTAPIKSKATALGRAGAGSWAIVLCKGGTDDFTTCCSSAVAAGAAILQLQSWDGGRVISSMHDASLVGLWVLDTGGTYQTTVAETVLSVFDHGNLTADGDASRLFLASSQAACEAAQGVTSTTGLVGGTGGTAGVYPLSYTGGAGNSLAGTFIVAGGAVTSVTITSRGIGFTSAPTLSLAACPGLTGASVTATLGNVGAYYVSGTTIFVTTVDRRVPDANLRVYKRLSSGTANHNLSLSTPTTKLYIENWSFHGGVDGVHQNISNNTYQGNVYTKDVHYKYCQGNGFTFAGDTVVMQLRPVGALCGTDNFHYDPCTFAPYVAPTYVEWDAISRWAGWVIDGTTNGQQQNNSSAHDAIGIRGATTPGLGDYHHAIGRGVHDVNLGRGTDTNALSWCFGITSRDSQFGNANFAMGATTGDASTMWLDNCTSSGARYDVITRVSATVKIYYSGLIPATPANDPAGVGTVAAYAA